MAERRQWSRRDSEQLLDTVGTLAAGAKVFSDGVQYTDDVGFWRWFTSEVVKAPTVGGAPLPLDNAEAIQQWASSLVGGGKERGLSTLLRGRTFEYDFVRGLQHDPVEFLKGNLWSQGTPLQDNQGIDAVRRSVFGGEETHQLKHALSESGGRVNLAKYGPGGAQEVDVVDVNERIASWRQSEVGQEAILRRGDVHPDVRNVIGDEQLEAAGDRRLDQAASGNAAPHITFEGVATQVGRGALLGAVVGVGLSTVSNYGRYRRGEIDGGQFGNLMIADSARGALMGGSVAAVNIPVQLAAQALGVGNPVTIPVMIVIGAGLRYVIDPMFGRGAYAEHLRDMEVHTDVTRAVAAFAHQCHASFEMQRSFLQQLVRLEPRASTLNAVSAITDNLLDSALDEI
jgi:hypothetical protein